jgi:hypothetical protein
MKKLVPDLTASGSTYPLSLCLNVASGIPYSLAAFLIAMFLSLTRRNALLTADGE